MGELKKIKSKFFEPYTLEFNNPHIDSSLDFSLPYAIIFDDRDSNREAYYGHGATIGFEISPQYSSHDTIATAKYELKENAKVIATVNCSKLYNGYCSKCRAIINAVDIDKAKNFIKLLAKL